MTGPLVRDSVEADVPAAHAIYAHHVVHGLASFELEPPTPEELARRRAELLECGLPWLVAERDGAIVGYTYAGPYRPRPAYRHALENSVYVHPRAQRAGVGDALLGALLARCEALGTRQMVAVIGDSANQPSIRLHEKHGFRHAGLMRSVGFKHGRWVDTVIMQRPLGEGDATLPA